MCWRRIVTNNRMCSLALSRGGEAPGLLCAGGGLSLTTECVLWLSLGVGKPLDYYVLEEDCHYSITWPSKYGCPAASGTV
jgi:hypothetical protein